MLVTGASGSVGTAVAREAVREGWAVIVHGRTQTKVDALVAELRQAGGEATGIVLDFMPEDAAASVVEQAASSFGRLDAVVDCIAGGPGGYRLTGLFKQTEPAGYAPFYSHSVAWFQRLAHAAYPPSPRPEAR
jgi:NAD(P)-dependent dehydrogenase (short-subunit alcohol dehydrogenase family)